MPLTRRIRFEWTRMAVTIGAVALIVWMFRAYGSNEQGASKETAPVPSSVGQPSPATPEAPSATAEDAAAQGDTPKPHSSQLTVIAEDTDGRAVAGARVDVVPNARYAAAPGSAPLAHAPPPVPALGTEETDDTGVARFEWVSPPWGARVFVHTDTTAGRSHTLYLGAEGATETRITLSPLPPLHVRATGVDGRDIDGALSRLFVPDPFATTGAADGTSGHEIEARSVDGARTTFPPVVHDAVRRGAALVVWCEAPGHVSSRVDVASVPQDGADLVVVLQRAVTIRGRCVDHEGGPVPGVPIVFRGLTPPGEALRAHGSDPESATTSSGDGTFAFEAVPDVGGVLVVSPRGGVPVEVTVPRGDAEGVADVGDLRTAVASEISGQVLDDQGLPVPGALVRLWHPLWRDSGRSVAADSEGRFSIRDLGDGLHSVRACEPPRGDAVEPMLGSVDEVPAGSKDVVVRLSSARMVEVRVHLDTDAETAAATHVQVVLTPGTQEPPDDGGAPWHRNPGVVRRRLGAAGVHSLVVRARGFAPFRGSVEVSDEGMVRVEATLTPEPTR